VNTTLENTIADREAEVVEEFGMFTDWVDKYEYIISLGKELPLIEESKKTDDLLIKGCQSRVWLHAKMENGKVSVYRRQRCHHHQRSD
jgi:cysteine desulfuration protein SufE